MRTRLILPVGLAVLVLLGLCTALAGQATPATGYTLTTADGLALILSADGQITGLQIEGQELVSAPAPALLLRDLSEAGSVITPNPVVNPGFEDGLAGWAELTNGGLDVSVVVSPTHSGRGTLELSNPVTDFYRFAAYASDPVTVTPTRRYRLSAWFRSATGYVSRPSGTPTLWQKDLWRNPPRTNGLYVQWLDADGQPLGDPQLAVPLHWNAAHWRLIRRELTAPPDATQARVAIGALLAGQTLWVDDVAFVPAPEQEVAVAGTVSPCGSRLGGAHGNSWELMGTRGNPGGCLVQSISLPESSLAISMTYVAHGDHIAVHGEVVDTAGRDRAVDVSWAVPFDPVIGLSAEQAQGGPLRLWWDDVHSSRQITQPVPYANAISAIYDGWLPMSLYPYAGVQISSKGVAIGLPLNRPQLAVLSYDGATGRYGAIFHLGISPQAVKVGPRATFDLMLYRFDPAWGFRDVIARHGTLQPEAYTTALPLYDYAGFEQGGYFTPSGVQRALAEDAANIYSAQYTAGELPLRISPGSEPRPTLDQVLAVVTDTLSSPRPWDAALARAITQSAVVDPNGDWSLKHIGVFTWAPDWWQAAWAANLDPDLTDGLASWIMDWRVTPAFTATTEAGAHLDGVQIDNFMSTPTFDLRPEALAAADWPLGYTPHTYQPAVHNGFGFREYLAFLRNYLDTEWGTDRGISINFWGLGHPNYLAEYIDGFGGEGSLKGNGEGSNWNPEILDYRRAIAYGRPYMFANQMTGLTASEAYTFSQTALLYGVVAGGGPNAADWEPEAQQIISDTNDLVTRYWAAGWEPLTYARSDSEDVWVERFGSPTKDEGRKMNGETWALVVGPSSFVFFPTHNHTDLTRTTTITIETVPLGLTDPASATITDLTSGQPVPFSVVDGNIVLTLTLGPRQTRVLQVSGGVAPPTPTPSPTPTATPSPSQCVGDANGNGIGDVVDIQTTAARSGCWVYLPLVVRNWRQPWPTPTPTPSPTPTPTPTPSSGAIVLADQPGGLELVSAPATVPITVGHVAYLPVEVQNYHRPITVSAQTLIHTYVNDVTASQPGETSPLTVGRLEAPHNELELQTLRMRPHAITLSFTPVGQVGNLSYGRRVGNLSYTLTLEPAIQPHTPLFSVHSAPFYTGLPEPFTQIWGPSCGSCPTTPGDPPGSTRDLACAKGQDSCHCHPIQKIRDPEADAHTRHRAPEIQRYASQFLRSVGGWGSIQIEPGRYLWDGLDWAFNDLAPQERDYSPLFSGIMDGNFGWMTCPAYTNPDGSVGFFDPHNTYLLEQYGAYVRELTGRYAPELRFIETGNEPCYGFYLCPCLDPGGPPCEATSGPNQPVCELGHESEEFAQVYGPFLSTAANVAAEAMAEANPDAWLIAGALEKSGEGLTATTRYMIEHGLLDRGNVALMIHQFPLPWPNWLPYEVDCSYFQDPNDPWALPAGCQTAPPFEDYTTPAGRRIHAQDVWKGIDEKIDASLLLHDAEGLGVLDRFYLFDTELHAGFHDNFGGEPNDVTTPAREAMAGLRIGAINAHQRFLGLEFIFAPSDPASYNLMVKHLAGATPVYAWDAPLTDADYSGLVYKLFTRASEVQVPGTSEVPGTFGEDIIALWSNADGPLELTLAASTHATRFKQATLTRLADAHGSLAITTTELGTPPQSILVQPLREFYFLSVISDRPGFGWLVGPGSD